MNNGDPYADLPPEAGTPLVPIDKLGGGNIVASSIIRFTPPVDPAEPWAPESGHGDYVFACTNIEYFLIESAGKVQFHIGFIRHSNRWRHTTDCYMDFYTAAGGLVHTVFYLRMDRDNNWGADYNSITTTIKPPGLTSELYRATGRFIVREKELK